MNNKNVRSMYKILALALIALMVLSLIGAALVGT